MGFDHVSLYVPKDKFEDCVKFYATTLAPLGYKEAMRPVPGVIGFGDKASNADFWLAAVDKVELDNTPHFAFAAPDRATVDKVHAEGLTAGGTCNGKPGLREHYGPNYYAAFIKDPAGHNAEVICRQPQN